MNTVQLQPQQLDKLPPALRKWEELGPHLTELRSGKATFYDQNLKQISQRALKFVNYSAQIQDMREARGLPKNAPLNVKEPTGYPRMDASSLQKMIDESVGGVKQLGKYVVQVRQNDSTPESKHYVLTTIDTRYGRLLSSQVYDATTNKMLLHSACRYKNEKEGIKLVGVYSEAHSDDARTGVKAKEIRYETILDAQFVNNI